MRLIGLAVILAVSLSLAPPPAASTPRIGVLGPTPMNPLNDVAFKQGLAQFGYTEGRNLVIEYRHAEGRCCPILRSNSFGSTSTSSSREEQQPWRLPKLRLAPFRWLQWT